MEADEIETSDDNEAIVGMEADEIETSDDNEAIDAVPPTEASIEPYNYASDFYDFRAIARFDPSIVDEFIENFVQVKKSVGPEALQRAVDTATRWAAVDTGAIEGLYSVDRGITFSVATTTAALDTAHTVIGEAAQKSIQDALRGYEYTLDLATGARPVTESVIKELHAVICASQGTYTVLTDQGLRERPLIKGSYKEYPNSPYNVRAGRIHSYASPHDTPPEMGRLVEQLRTAEFQDAHPVMQAAYAHYAFVSVHPFADGNGRVARALASVYLYRHPGIPLVIFADQKAEYIDALEEADHKRSAAFVNFIEERAIDAISMISTDMKRALRPRPAERMQELAQQLINEDGLLHSEVDAIAGRLHREWQEALGRSIDAAGDVKPLGLVVQNKGTVPSVEGFRKAPEAMPVVLHGESAAPATAALDRRFFVLVPRPGTSRAAFVLFAAKDQPICEVHLREVHPTFSTALKYKLEVLAEDVVCEAVDTLVEQGQESLRRSGHIL